MNRREFSAGLAAAGLGLGLGLPTLVRAQGAPVDGQDYVRLVPPVPVAPPAGKVDVMEFFSYACPHCNDFEPVLERWTHTLGADVHFHRIPVPFLWNAQNFQALYFTLEAMNLVDKMQQKVFDAVHKEHQRLLEVDDILALMTRNGVDAAKFKSVFNSFTVRTKVQQADRIVETSHINEVPTLVVAGRFSTTVARAHGPEQALRVVDALVKQAKSGQ